MILFTWTKPATFIDAHSYAVIMTNIAAATQRNVTVENNVTEYSYVPKDGDDYCSPLKFCVLSVRSNRVGEISGCITTSLKRGMYMEINTGQVFKGENYC